MRTLLRAQASAEFPALSAAAADEFDEEEAAIARRADESNDTDAVVSAHLVTFASVNELQVQNQKLLRITREMGVQLERGEEAARARREGEENRAVEEAHELILRLKDEIQSERAKTEAFGRERDMFRRMLGQGRAAINGTPATDVEANGTANPAEVNGSVDPATASTLATVQAEFDAFRTEITIDAQRLREDLAGAQREAGQARTDLAKARAQADFLSERFKLLNESYELQAGEVKQSSQRIADLQSNMARQDLTTHKATEDLLALRSTTEQLRHENTTLKSEREVGKVSASSISPGSTDSRLLT